MELALRILAGTMSYCETHIIVSKAYFFHEHSCRCFVAHFSYIINKEMLFQKISFILPI